MSEQDDTGHRIIITGDGSPTLHSEWFGETYHSLRGALAEAHHVFLETSGVRARLEAGLATDILEIGFGTGLNYLITAQTAVRVDTALRYEAFELHPLPAEQLRGLRLGELVGAQDLEADLIEAIDRYGSGDPVVTTIEVMQGPPSLLIRIEDAAAARIAEASFDAVYHDAFSPKNNPALWTPEFLKSLAASLRPGGRLVTYCVAGEVRRRLADAGLEVTKHAGPAGGKREMTVARRPAT